MRSAKAGVVASKAQMIAMNVGPEVSRRFIGKLQLKCAPDTTFHAGKKKPFLSQKGPCFAALRPDGPPHSQASGALAATADTDEAEAKSKQGERARLRNVGRWVDRDFLVVDAAYLER
jgi:hypothetical protein